MVQQSTGAIVYADMAHGKFSGWVPIATVPGWQVAAVADLAGDGHADVVIQSTEPGLHELLFADMAGGQFAGWGKATTGLDADYKVAGIADLNQDGHADLVLQQQSTGALFYAVEGAHGFDHWKPVSMDWQVA